MLGDLGKLIVAKGFKKLPKVQKLARSGHTGHEMNKGPPSSFIKHLSLNFNLIKMKFT